MRRSNGERGVWGLALVGLAAATLASVPGTPVDGSGGAAWTEPWLDGVAGYETAFRRAEGPVFVYFYTDWCGYCRQFEAELLSDDSVIGFLATLQAVRINPEKGLGEAELARRYGVAGFPALFLHEDGRPESFVTVRRTLVEGGRLRLKTPDEFIAELGG